MRKSSPCGVESVEMFVFTDVLVDQLAGPDVDWMVGLELDTVSRINVVTLTVIIVILGWSPV